MTTVDPTSLDTSALDTPAIDEPDRPTRPPRRLRPDIEGLRGIAILAVVAAHAGLLGFSGGYVGVDVFFVISGYVITTQILGELQDTGRLRLAAFYARRAKRLLPMALLVLIITGVAGYLLLNPIRSQQLLTDVGWAAGYGLAWRLAWLATDYLNATSAPSAVQHYWSLSIEEQFYLVWPVLLLITWRLAQRWRRGGPAAMRTVVTLLLVIVLGSFAVNVWTTAHAQPWAFFGLHARAWELGVGALLAASPGLRTMSARIGWLVSWAGVAMILCAILAYTDELLFPGWYALLPVAGAALVIAGGSALDGGGAAWLLGRGWLQVCGGLSYGWYLWHWPLVILGPIVWPGLDNLHGKVLLAVAALGLTVLTYVLFEHPIRVLRWPLRHPRRSVVLAVGASAAVVILALGAASVQSRLTPATAAAQASAAETDTAVTDAVAAALGSADEAPGALPAALDPSPEGARMIVPEPQSRGCHKDFTDTSAALPAGCVFGQPDARTTVVLFGDSHALQWFPAMQKIALERGWRLLSMTKSSCTPFDLRTYNESLRREYTECAQWRADAERLITAEKPALVVMSGQVNQRDHGLYGDARGYSRAWGDGVSTAVRRLVAAGSRVAVLEDTPNPGQDVPDCIADAQQDSSSTTAACAYGKAGGLDPAARRDAEVSATTAAGGVPIDPTGWLCAASSCPVVVADHLVFRDEQHLSTSYARWLSAALAARLPS